MYGAVPYVVKAFGVDRHTAFQLVCEWLDSQCDIAVVEVSRARSKSRAG
jgi:hypothetical protein